MRGGDRSPLAFVLCLLVCSPAVSSQPDAHRDLDWDRDPEPELDMRGPRTLQEAARGTGDPSQVPKTAQKQTGKRAKSNLPLPDVGRRRGRLRRSLGSDGML